MTVHEPTKKYSCAQCPFTSRTSAHLKRHSRLHTGAKPFRCPYCSYKCNNMENLRRHVLSTTKHPGRTVYECRICRNFKSNAAKDFKQHLVLVHDRDGREAAGYVAGLYQEEGEEENEEEDGMAGQLPTALDQMLPMFVIPKDVAVEVDAEAWNLIGQYDVEESGTLVPFQSSEEELFQEHF